MRPTKFEKDIYAKTLAFPEFLKTPTLGDLYALYSKVENQDIYKIVPVNCEIKLKDITIDDFANFRGMSTTQKYKNEKLLNDIFHDSVMHFTDEDASIVGRIDLNNFQSKLHFFEPVLFTSLVTGIAAIATGNPIVCGAEGILAAEIARQFYNLNKHPFRVSIGSEDDIFCHNLHEIRKKIRAAKGETPLSPGEELDALLSKEKRNFSQEEIDRFNKFANYVKQIRI